MTKEQWFGELNRLLSVLPADERRKAEEYYRELFADKEEAGASEASILAEFGSPYAAGGAILEEFKAENPDFRFPEYGETQPPFTPQPYLKSEQKGTSPQQPFTPQPYLESEQKETPPQQPFAPQPYLKSEQKETPPQQPFTPQPYRISERQSGGRRTLWTAICVFGAIPLAALYLALGATAFALYGGLLALYVSGIALPILAGVYHAAPFFFWLGVGLLLVGAALALTLLVHFVVRLAFRGVARLLRALKRSILGETA